MCGGTWVIGGVIGLIRGRRLAGKAGIGVHNIVGQFSYITLLISEHVQYIIMLRLKSLLKDPIS
jgi:hypothetical protein